MGLSIDDLINWLNADDRNYVVATVCESAGNSIPVDYPPSWYAGTVQYIPPRVFEIRGAVVELPGTLKGTAFITRRLTLVATDGSTFDAGEPPTGRPDIFWSRTDRVELQIDVMAPLKLNLWFRPAYPSEYDPPQIPPIPHVDFAPAVTATDSEIALEGFVELHEGSPNVEIHSYAVRLSKGHRP